MAETEYVSRRALWQHRLSDEVVRGVAAKIRSGELAPGAPLPTRPALMAEFVTSDGVVEQAIGKLVDSGLVVRGAEGDLRVSAVHARAEEFEIPEADEATHADVVAMLELRIGVESEAAALAAERRSEAQLAAIARAAEAFDRAVAAGSGRAQADYQFHLAIAEASGNRYVFDLTDYLGPLLIPRMRIDVSAGRNAASDEQSACGEHGRIVDAIAARDAEGARTAMRRHLTRALSSVRSITGGEGT